MLNPNDPSQDILETSDTPNAASRLTIPNALLEKLGLQGVMPGATYNITVKAGSLGDAGLEVEALSAQSDLGTEMNQVAPEALATDGLDEGGMADDLMGEAEQPIIDEAPPLAPPGAGKPIPTRKSPKEMFGRKPRPYGPDGKRMEDEEEAA